MGQGLQTSTGHDQGPQGFSSRPGPDLLQRLEGGRTHLVAVGVLLLCAAVLRFYFIQTHSAFMQSDEALTGLAAKHILTRGQWPIFAFGEERSGSVMAYLAAPLFSLFGASNLVLKVVIGTVSLAFAYLIYLLAKRIGGGVVGLLALALVAFAPPFLIMWSVHAAAEYLIMVVCGTASLVLCDRILFGHGSGNGRAASASLWLYALLGLALGVGFWASPLVISFIAAVWIVLFLRDWKCFFRLSFVVFVLFFLVGNLPALLFNLIPELRAANGLPDVPNWVSYTSLLSAPGESLGSRIRQLPQTLAQVATVSAPVLLGGVLWEYEVGWPRRIAALIMVSFWLAAVAFVAVLRVRLWLRRRGSPRSLPQPIDAPLLQFLLTLLVFAVSQYRWLVREPRYLLPVFVFLPIAGATWLHWLISRHKAVGGSLLALILILNLASTVAFSASLDPDHGLWPKDARLIEYMVDHAVRHPVANYWIAYSVAFESDEQVVPVPIGHAKLGMYPELLAQPASTFYLFPKREKNDRYLNFFSYGLAGPQWTARDFEEFLRDRGVPDEAYSSHEFDHYVLFEVPAPVLDSQEISLPEASAPPDADAQVNRHLNSLMGPGDAVIVHPPELAGRLELFGLPQSAIQEIPGGTPLDETEVGERLDTVAREHRRLFVLFGDTSANDPGGLVEAWLNQHAYRAHDLWIGDMRLVLYGTAPWPAPERPTFVRQVSFGNQIELAGVALGMLPLEPKDVAPVTLFWQTRQPVTDNLKVFLHLVDDQGKLVAQRDSEPVGGLRPTSSWEPSEQVVDRYGLWLPEALPPGEYQLIVGLYDPVDGARLPAYAETGELLGDSVLLGTISVQP